MTVLETGAAENSACLKWLHRHTATPERLGTPLTRSNPACAKFKFGNGDVVEVRIAADIPDGIAGIQAALTTFPAGAEIPTTLRLGDLEPFRGKLNPPRNFLRLGKMGAEAPLRLNKAGRYVLGAVSLDAEDGRPLGGGATQSDSRFPKANGLLRTKMANCEIPFQTSRMVLINSRPPNTSRRASRRRWRMPGDTAGLIRKISRWNYV